MLMYGIDKYNIVKQLSSNLKFKTHTQNQLQDRCIYKKQIVEAMPLNIQEINICEIKNYDSLCFSPYDVT